MATQLRITPPVPRKVHQLSATFVLENRAAIEMEIERLIDLGDHVGAERWLMLLDAIDGDCDIETEPEEWDPTDLAELEEWRFVGARLPLPIYGDDQSAGPINETEVIAWAGQRNFPGYGLYTKWL